MFVENEHHTHMFINLYPHYAHGFTDFLWKLPGSQTSGILHVWYKACCQPALSARVLTLGHSHLGTGCLAWCDFPSGLHAYCTFGAKPKCCLLLPYQAFLELCLTSPPTELSFLQSAGNHEMPSMPGCTFRSRARHSKQYHCQFNSNILVLRDHWV